MIDININVRGVFVDGHEKNQWLNNYVKKERNKEDGAYSPEFYFSVRSSGVGHFRYLSLIYFDHEKQEREVMFTTTLSQQAVKELREALSCVEKMEMVDDGL